MSVKQAWISFSDQVNHIDVFELVSQLFLLGLLVYGPAEWFVKVPLVAIAVLSLVLKGMRKSEWTWFILGLLIMYGSVISWYETDNHKYVMAYVSGLLACACLVSGEDRLKLLRNACGPILGIVMIAAVIWKLANADYVNGDFFVMTMITDSRFAEFTALLTPLTEDALSANHHVLKQLDLLNPIAGIPAQVELETHYTVGLWATFLTWWTVLIEGTIGLLFFIPLKGVIVRHIRHITLLMFMVTTYAVAIVPGFCWMLLCLAIGTTDERDKIFRPLYVGMIVLVQFYQVI